MSKQLAEKIKAEKVKVGMLLHPWDYYWELEVLDGLLRYCMKWGIVWESCRMGGAS